MHKTLGIILYIASFGVLAAQSDEARIEQFVQGNFFLVGQYPDSKETYAGEASFIKSE